MMTEILSAFSALALVLAAMVLMAWAVRRFGLLPGQPRITAGNKKIEILESKMLDARNRLVVVRWEGKEYFLSSNPSGVTVIDSSTGAIKPDTFEKMVDEHVSNT